MTSLEGGGDAKAISKSWLFKPLHQDTMDYDMDYVHRGFPKTDMHEPLFDERRSLSLWAHNYLGPKKEITPDMSQSIPPKKSLLVGHRGTTSEAERSSLLLPYHHLRPVCKALSRKVRKGFKWSSIYQVILHDGQCLYLQIEEDLAHNQQNNKRTVQRPRPLWAVLCQQQELYPKDTNRATEERLCRHVGQRLTEITNKLKQGDAIRIAQQLLQECVARKAWIVVPENCLWDSNTSTLALLKHGWQPTNSRKSKEAQMSNKVPKAKDGAVNPWRKEETSDAYMYGLLFGSLLQYEHCREGKLPSRNTLLQLRQRNVQTWKAACSKVHEQHWEGLLTLCLGAKDSEHPSPKRVLRHFTSLLKNLKLRQTCEDNYTRAIADVMKEMPAAPLTLIEYCEGHLGEFSRRSQPLTLEQIWEAATTYHTLGCAQHLMTRHEGALRSQARAEALFKAALGPEHPFLTRAWSYIAAECSHLREADIVVHYCLKAVQVLQPVYQQTTVQSTTLGQNLALAFTELGQDREAIRHLRNITPLAWVEPESTKDNVYVRAQFADNGLEWLIKTAEYQEQAVALVGNNQQDDASLSIAYETIAADYHRAGQFKSAIDNYLLATELLEKAAENNSAHLGDIYNIIGCIYDQMYNYDKALVYYLKAEQNAVLHPENTKSLWLANRNLWVTYNNLGQTAEANKYREKATQLKSSSSGQLTGDQLLERFQINQMFEIAKTYASNMRNEQALTLYQQIIELLTNGKYQNQVLLASTYTRMSLIYAQQKDYQLTIEYGKAAEEIYNVEPNVELTQYAFLYATLTNAYLNLQQYELALPYAKQAVEKAQLLCGEEMDILYNNLALAYAGVGDAENARLYYRKLGQSGLDRRYLQGTLAHTKGSSPSKPGKEGKAEKLGRTTMTSTQNKDKLLTLEIARLTKKKDEDAKQSGTHSSIMAHTLNAIALTYDKFDHFEQALEYYRQSLAIYESLKEISSSATVLSNMAGTYENLDQFEKANECRMHALTILSADEQNYSIDIIRLCMNIGISLETQGNFSDAADYLARAAAQVWDLGSRYIKWAIDVELHLQSTCSILGRYAEALAALNRLKEIYAKTPREDTILVEIYLREADCHLSMSQSQKALQACQNADALATRLGGSALRFKDDIASVAARIGRALHSASAQPSAH